jgi:hypothetical protein
MLWVELAVCCVCSKTDIKVDQLLKYLTIRQFRMYAFHYHIEPGKRELLVGLIARGVRVRIC